MAIHQRDLEVIEKSLTDYKVKAGEMYVGVNYMALDDERRRQEHLLREIRNIESEISSPALRHTKLNHLAASVCMDLNYNTQCLQYLTGISELERSVGEIAACFAERSIKLSNPNSLQTDIKTHKSLTDNVKSCWSYIDHLVGLAHIHLKTSSEYHQFYHEANEIEAKLAHQIEIARKDPPQSSPRDFAKEANDIREQLDALRSLWKRSVVLVKQSESIVPIRLRMGGVANGNVVGDPNNRPVMVRAMVSLAGPDYKIQSGDHLQLIDNRKDVHLWRVKTTSGIVDVPAICLWLVDNDVAATERAISIKQQCRKSWLEVVQLITLRLYEMYTDLFNQFNLQKAPKCSHQEALNAFFHNLQNYLISTVGKDLRLKSAIETFRKNVVILNKSDKLQSGDSVLRESDIMRIHTPLLRLQDHLGAMIQMQDDMKVLNDHIAAYMSEIDNDRRRIAASLDQFTRQTKRCENQLGELMRDINQWQTRTSEVPYAKQEGHLKVTPFYPQRDRHRSRSQPPMTFLNVSSTYSSVSSESELHESTKTRKGGRRFKSQALPLDAMVQIGNIDSNVECQHQLRDTTNADPEEQTKSKQRSVMTQIGRYCVDGSSQVDLKSLASYDIEIANEQSSRRSQIQSSKSDDSDTHDCSVESSGHYQVFRAKKKREPRYDTTAQIGPNRSASMGNLIHSSTQLGIVMHNRSVSPIQELQIIGCRYCRLLNNSQHQMSEEPRMMNTHTQVGALYANSQQQTGVSADCIMTSSTQVGVINRNSRNSPIDSGLLPTQKVNVRAQVEHKSMPDLFTSSTMIERIPLKPNDYVTEMSQRPLSSNSTTQEGMTFCGNFTQSDAVAHDGRTVKPQHYEKFNFSAQVGKQSVTEEQIPMSMAPKCLTHPPRQTAMSPLGMSVQVRRHMYDDTTQVAQILTHDEVQTQAYPAIDICQQNMQVVLPNRQNTSRSRSLPALCQTSETQIGPMVVHESLSPIGTDRYVEVIQPTTQQTQQAVLKVSKNKRIQSLCAPNISDAEMQIGKLVTEGETQTQKEPERFEDQAIAPTLIAFQQKELPMSDVGLAEAQVQPKLCKKKLQVAIAMNEHIPEKMHNKKLQVSLVSQKEMFDVQLETQPLSNVERFDVSCYTMILPDNISKKVQVSLPLNNDDQTIKVIDNPELFAPVPKQSTLESSAYLLETSNKAVETVDTGCEALSPISYYDVQCQSALAEPKLKTQERRDTGCDPIEPVRTLGKKMQVELGKLTSPMTTISIQTRVSQTQHKSSETTDVSARMLDDAAPIFVQPTPIQVFSAPPEPAKCNTRDISCEVLDENELCDTYTQANNGPYLGKKLQVAIGFEHQSKELYAIAVSQANYVEGLITPPVSTILTPVYAAPPSKAAVQLRSVGCDVKLNPSDKIVTNSLGVQTSVAYTPTQLTPFSKPTIYAVAMQTVDLIPPKPVTYGKKLQVPSASYAPCTKQTNTETAKETPMSQSILVSSCVQTNWDETFQPNNIIHFEATQRVFSAPPTDPKSLFEDKECDAFGCETLFDAEVQVVDNRPQKSLVVGKKLQVNPPAYSILSTQTSSNLFANDFAKSTCLSRGIQTSTSSLETSTIQTFQANTSSAPLEIAITQARGIDANPPPPPIIQVFDSPKSFAAPETSRTQLIDEGNDALIPVDIFNVSTQSLPSEPVDKQNQRGLPVALETSVVQTGLVKASPPSLEIAITQARGIDATPPPPPIIQVFDSPKSFAAPEPSRTQLIDEGNDALIPVDKFNVSTQSLPSEPVDKQNKRGLPVALETSVVQTAHAILQKPQMINNFVQCELHPSAMKQSLTMKYTSIQSENLSSLEISTVQTQLDVQADVFVQEPPKNSLQLFSSPPKSETADRAIDAKPMPQMNVIDSQTIIEHLSVFSAQSSSEQLTVAGTKVQLLDGWCDPIPRGTAEQSSQSETVPKLGKKLQVMPASLVKGLCQTVVWEERVSSPLPVIAKVEMTAVKSAPPNEKQDLMVDTSCDPSTTQSKMDVFTQYIPSSFEEAIPNTQPTLVTSTVQTTFDANPSGISPSTVIVKSASSNVFAELPSTKLIHEIGIQAIVRPPAQDISMQHETRIEKPVCRNVRIQKSGSVFDSSGTADIHRSGSEFQYSSPSSMFPRTLGCDLGVQYNPTVIAGMTQTSPSELSHFQKSIKTQAALESPTALNQKSHSCLTPSQSRQPENLFSFVHETKTRVTSHSRRGSSQGLIPYKTQVFSNASSLSLSVPTMMNAPFDDMSPTTITDSYLTSNRPTNLQMPRRYASRMRSPTARGAYSRKNRSMENLIFKGSHIRPRYISEGDLSEDYPRMQQELELEQRCTECINQCVRHLGYEHVVQILRNAEAASGGETCDEYERHLVKRRRLHGALGQPASTETLICSFCHNAYNNFSSTDRSKNFESRANVTSSREFTRADCTNDGFNYTGRDNVDWASVESSYDPSKPTFYRWITRPPTSGAIQTDPNPQDLDQLRKSRALSAYCSDFELQQSGLKFNYEENDSFTIVAWKSGHHGEDKLEIDTAGRLLKFSLVGARVPGTGAIISAADAFYRGILRVVYMDTENHVILPLPTAINANAVIVEKHYSTGMGIALSSNPHKYPIECTAVWQTPNMRRRTYRVNYIQISDTEQINVERALNEGIIDESTGELVGVRAHPSTDLRDPLLHIRESSVGTGETMHRKRRPERFNVREAIVNDIVSVDLIQPEIIIEPNYGADRTTTERRYDDSLLITLDSNSDLEV